MALPFQQEEHRSRPSGILWALQGYSPLPDGHTLTRGRGKSPIGPVSCGCLPSTVSPPDLGSS